MKNTVDFLSDVFLFEGVKRETLTRIVNDITPEIQNFESKEIIYSPNEYEKKLGFVISGECSVERLKPDGNTVPLNLLGCGDSFGIVAILSDEEEFPTLITATKSSKVLFIKKSDAVSMIKKHPDVAMNVISFLTKKIIFLNSKIATFSSDTVEDKLAKFIILEAKRRGAVEFPFNCKRSAEAINSGRASLYRAITSLTEANLIKLENKKIYILDLKSLERMTK